jgi:hypothetical protein
VGRGHASLLTDLDTWHSKPFRGISIWHLLHVIYSQQTVACCGSRSLWGATAVCRFSLSVSPFKSSTLGHIRSPPHSSMPQLNRVLYHTDFQTRSVAAFLKQQSVGYNPSSTLMRSAQLPLPHA